MIQHGIDNRNCVCVTAIVLFVYLMSTVQKMRKQRQQAILELQHHFFPPLTENLRILETRLRGEELDHDGYVDRLAHGWKSTLILDFHREYQREEEMFTSLKQDRGSMRNRPKDSPRQVTRDNESD